MDPIFSQQFQMPTPAPRGGMFGGGDSSWKNALMAAVAGFMARRSPGVSNNIINGLQDAQTMKQRMAYAEQVRRQNMQDAVTQHGLLRDYDIAHPMPQEPDELTRHMIAAGIDPNSPQGKAAYAASMDPVVMTPYGPMLRSQVIGAGQPEVLTSLPPGAKPIGGAGPSQAPQPFPGY